MKQDEPFVLSLLRLLTGWRAKYEIPWRCRLTLALNTNQLLKILPFNPSMGRYFYEFLLDNEQFVSSYFYFYLHLHLHHHRVISPKSDLTQLLLLILLNLLYKRKISIYSKSASRWTLNYDPIPETNFFLFSFFFSLLCRVNPNISELNLFGVTPS